MTSVLSIPGKYREVIARSASCPSWRWITNVAAEGLAVAADRPVRAVVVPYRTRSARALPAHRYACVSGRGTGACGGARSWSNSGVTLRGDNTAAILGRRPARSLD
jgi:hypothetical protein